MSLPIYTPSCIEHDNVTNQLVFNLICGPIDEWMRGKRKTVLDLQFVKLSFWTKIIILLFISVFGSFHSVNSGWWFSSLRVLKLDSCGYIFMVCVGKALNLHTSANVRHCPKRKMTRWALKIEIIRFTSKCDTFSTRLNRSDRLSLERRSFFLFVWAKLSSPSLIASVASLLANNNITWWTLIFRGQGQLQSAENQLHVGHIFSCRGRVSLIHWKSHLHGHLGSVWETGTGHAPEYATACPPA